MASTPVCKCDANELPAITNLPGLPQIAYRAGDFNSFRSALLTPLLDATGRSVEQALNTWQSGVGANPSLVDLAVMMVEWWAYLADILTFYNERIANEDYLGTAIQPDTPAALIAILGYRPRPAIGATGTLGALLTPAILPGQTVTLPEGLQFQSKPAPGQAPQTYELAATTTLSLPAQVPATTASKLVGTQANGAYGILLQGAVTSLSSGSTLLLDARDDSAAPVLIRLTSVPVTKSGASGGKQTLVTFSAVPPAGLSAGNARLRKANQSAALWTVNGSATDVVSGKVVQLAGLARQIRGGDWVVFQASGGLTQVAQVTAAVDVLGDAGANGNGGPRRVGTASTTYTPIPVLHTQLTVATLLNTGFTTSLGQQQTTVLFGWVDAGVLVDQPGAQWKGNDDLEAISPAQFPVQGSTPVLIEDSYGIGLSASGTVTAHGGLSVDLPASNPATALQPRLNVYYNLLPVTQGKTVANEILGSGDGTVAGQSFALAKSPVTYLMKGTTYQSTIALTVNGQPWTEVHSFYRQPANATVFTTREDASQKTHVDFGDGVNCARLPTGMNNVVATYRIGAGAASPPAGKLTMIAQSYPGLQSVVNPVAVSGGSDAVPAAQLKRLAPQSVLTFWRAVSVFDYQALAAGAPGVMQASAVWDWDESNQFAGVTVYVTGEPNVNDSVQTLLEASGDPNRPVHVKMATEIDIGMALTLIVKPGVDRIATQAAVTAALCDPETGLFAPARAGIGQGVFNSEIEAACLDLTGVVATVGLRMRIGRFIDPATLHNPGEGAYFSLAESDFYLTMEVSGDGQ